MNDDMRKLIDETQRLDREATPGPWRPEGASIRVNLPGGIEYQWATAAYPRDNNLSAHYRTAAPALAAEVERLDARLAEVERERDEALLTLAAEQGRQEGAPSEYWRPIRASDGSLIAWRNEQTGAIVEAYIERRSATDMRHAQWRWRTRDGRKGRADTARAAMLAADAATG